MKQPSPLVQQRLDVGNRDDAADTASKNKGTCDARSVVLIILVLSALCVFSISFLRLVLAIKNNLPVYLMIHETTVLILNQLQKTVLEVQKTLYFL